MQTSLLINISLDQLGEIIRENVKAEIADLAIKAMPDESPEYLSRKEVGRLLRISLVTVDDWANKGLLKRCRVGTRTRFKTSEVKAFADSPNGRKYSTKH